MAASGGHWVKGNFIPAADSGGGGGGGSMGNRYALPNPGSLEEIQKWARESSHMSGQDPNEFLVSYNLDQRELLVSPAGQEVALHVEMIAGGKDLDRMDAYGYLDRSVRAIYNVEEGRFYIDLNMAGVRGGGRMLDEQESAAALDNAYKMIDRLKRVGGFPDKEVWITDAVGHGSSSAVIETGVY